MASPGQRKGACGHIMASFDLHSRCARCRDKSLGDDACVKKLPSEFCELLTPEQVLQLSTPTYKIRKEKILERESLIDPSTVTVLSSVDQDKSVGASSSLSTSQDLSLPQPSFKKDLQDLDEKWSLRMARLEALITMGQRPQQPTFSPVKAPVSHAPPAGSLSQAPFLLSAVPSGQAGPASGPDRTSFTTTTTSVGMTSPLENLYPEPEAYIDSTEPVFSQPGPVSYGDLLSHSVPVSSSSYLPPEPVEEGEVSDPEEQPDFEAGDSDKVLSEEQNYRETVRGVRAFMGWTHIPDLEYSPSSKSDNPWVGHRAQPVGKVSVDLPPEDWLCRKLETLNLVLLEGYPSKSSEPGGLHVDQFLRPPKSQNRWYGIHPAEPTDPLRPRKSVNTWPNDAAKLNSAFPRICKPAVANSHPPSCPINQDTLRKWEKSAKETSYVCNQAAGFNRCITKIQDSVQEHLKSLQAELSKGKSSSKAQASLDELHYLASFNQNVSFAIGKSLQHLSDFIFVQMANLTLTRRDSYLENLKAGVKPDTFSALRNCPLNGYALFPDDIIRKAEDEITHVENARRTSQPGPGRGGFTGGFKKQQQQGRFQPYPTNWTKSQDTTRSGGPTGKDMPAWKSFGGRGRARGRGRGGQPGRGTRPAKDNHPYK